ncbi:MAG: glycosyltransferase family 2 protein [Candidatus Omnitrophica bacterium]|nr:glycosyltransferase family 2 protein [Candidatus Omnitrophota bacterium]
MKLVVLIPTYNEEKTIAQVIQDIPRNVEKINEIEILVIDDGSADKTVSIARNAGATVISYSKNKGLGFVFSRGIEEALKRGADILVNIDADAQFNPKEIPKLIKPILEKKAEMVAGTRFESKNSLSQIPFLKKWGNRVFTSLINILTREKFTDTQCGFRAYSREALLRLNLFGRFTYTQEVFLDLVNKGLKIEQIPITVRYYKERQAKISASFFRYFLQTIIIILRTFRDYKPLLFFGIPGVSIFGVGILFWFYSFIYWLLHHQTTPIRMYFFVGTGLITFGFLLLVLAFIADMLKRIRQNQEEILYKLKKKEYEKSD